MEGTDKPRVTAFACVADDQGRLLLLEHVRLGVTRWEFPGGHVEPDESIAEAAARETREEAGLRVEVGDVIADAHHRWRGRTVRIVFLRADPLSALAPPVATEEHIASVAWIDPATLESVTISPLAIPVIRHLRSGSPGILCFDATHHETSEGWEPVVTREWIS